MVKKKISNVAVLLLPEELVTEVLIRLPVKTLLVCKSVSKPWLSLISNPNFIKSHLYYVINNNNNNSTLLSILDPSPVNNVPVVPIDHDIEQVMHAILRFSQYTICVLDALRDVNRHDLSSFHVYFDRVVIPSVFGSSRVVGTGCCNGIVCLMDDYRNVVYLWNPSIRRFKEVRVPELFVAGSSCVKMGFGYDSTSNDYKVFRTSCEMNLGGLPLKMQVYSVNDDSWREFQGPVWGYKLVEGGFQRNDFIVVDGILYFSNWDEQHLVSFDLRKEVFGLVSFPGFVQRKWSDVLDFKGSVAVVFESVSGVDLWTLDDDVSGRVSSWTKLFSIEADPKLNMWLSCYLGAGQFFGKKLIDGNIFVYNLLYDCEKKETKYFGLGEDNILATLKYTETLVSLDGFHRVEEISN